MVRYNGKPIYYQGTVEVLTPLKDVPFGFEMNGAVYGSRNAYILHWGRTQVSTGSNDRPVYSFYKNWFSSAEPQFQCNFVPDSFV